MDFVVPVSLEFASFDTELVHFVVTDLAPLVVLILVEPTVNLKAGCGPGRPDQLDDNLQRFEGNALPFARDVTEDAMFDLVPLARPGGKMANLDDHPRLVGKLLKLELPQSVSGAFASAAISRDQQPTRVAVSLLSQSSPPATYRLDCELRRVVCDPQRNTGFVVVQVVDSVGNGFAQFGIRKIVDVDFYGVPLSNPFDDTRVRHARITIIIGITCYPRIRQFVVRRFLRRAVLASGVCARGRSCSLGGASPAGTQQAWRACTIPATNAFSRRCDETLSCEEFPCPWEASAEFTHQPGGMGA